MWIETVTNKNGQVRYKYNERYRCPFSNKLKRVSVTYNTNSKQAQKEALFELQDKINLLTNPDVYCDKTMQITMREYVKMGSKFKKPTTQKNYERLQNTLLTFFTDDILLSNLTTYIIQSILNAFQAKYSFNYTRNAFSLIKQTLKYARRMNYISSIAFIENMELQRPQKNN